MENLLKSNAQTPNQMKDFFKDKFNYDNRILQIVQHLS